MFNNTTNGSVCPSVGRQKIDWQDELARHGRWLRTIAFARLGEPEAVEDVMQEVALAAVRQAAPIADPGKIAPWLYQLTVRQILQFRRKMGRQRKLTDNYAQRVQPTDQDIRSADPLSFLLSQERQQMIRESLRRLPEQDAEILLLKYTENWSYRQLAEHLGISHSAVESRLHRARGRLRRELISSEVVGRGRSER